MLTQLLHNLESWPTLLHSSRLVDSSTALHFQFITLNSELNASAVFHPSKIISRRNHTYSHAHNTYEQHFSRQQQRQQISSTNGAWSITVRQRLHLGKQWMTHMLWLGRTRVLSAGGRWQLFGGHSHFPPGSRFVLIGWPGRVCRRVTSSSARQCWMRCW